MGWRKEEGEGHSTALRRGRAGRGRARRRPARSAARARRGTADISPALRCTLAPRARTPWGSSPTCCRPGTVHLALYN